MLDPVAMLPSVHLSALAYSFAARFSQFITAALVDPAGDGAPVGGIVLDNAVPPHFQVSFTEVRRAESVSVGSLPARQGVARVAERFRHGRRECRRAHGLVTAVRQGWL